MLEYKVVIMDDERTLEEVLNEWARMGWKFNSMESEYKTNIIIFEKEKNDESQNGATCNPATETHWTIKRTTSN